MRSEDFVKKPTPPEPGTVRYEFYEAEKAYDKTLPVPSSVHDEAAYNKWLDLPEVERYRRIKFFIRDLMNQYPNLTAEQINDLKLEDLPEWNQS